LLKGRGTSHSGVRVVEFLEVEALYDKLAFLVLLPLKICDVL